MSSVGILFALLTTLTWSIGIFPFTQAARRLGVNPLNHFRLLLATILIGIINLFFFRDHFLQLFTPEFHLAWIWLGLSGIIGLTIGDYFAFEMYSILGARMGSILTTFAPAAALLLGAPLIGEHISFTGIIGIAITILGVNYISLGKGEINTIPNHGHGSITRGIVTGILAALCQGAGLVLAKKGMIAELQMHTSLHPFAATFIRLSIGTLSLFMLTTLQRNWKTVYKPIRENKEDGIKYAVSGTIFGPTLGVSLSLFTVALIDPSVAQTIFSMVPAFAMVLAALFFKEKLTVPAVVGLLVAISGVLILIWRDKIDLLF